MSRKNFPSVWALAILGVIGLSALALAEEMRVRDIPIPEGASDMSYMKRRGDVRFLVTTDFQATGSFYAKKLAEQRWTKSGRDNLQRNFWVQTFSKDNLRLEVRVDSREGGSEVRLTPKGLLWDEDDQPTPKELPLPKDATDVDYDDFFDAWATNCGNFATSQPIVTRLRTPGIRQRSQTVSLLSAISQSNVTSRDSATGCFRGPKATRLLTGKTVAVNPIGFLNRERESSGRIVAKA